MEGNVSSIWAEHPDNSGVFELSDTIPMFMAVGVAG